MKILDKENGEKGKRDGEGEKAGGAVGGKEGGFGQGENKGGHEDIGGGGEGSRVIKHLLDLDTG